MTKRSTAVRCDIKERRRQITEEATASLESEDGAAAAPGEEQASYEASEDQEDSNQLEIRSRAFNNQSESDNSDMSASQPKAYSDSLLKMPTLNEDHVDDFLELEAKLKKAFDEEGCAEVRASSVGDDQGRGRVGGGGGATGARNALLSPGTKSSPGLKMRTYSLQTPTILEGMASSPAPFFSFAHCLTFIESCCSKMFRIVCAVFGNRDGVLYGVFGICHGGGPALGQAGGFSRLDGWRF